MYVEAFSAGKDPQRPWDNEDRIVAYEQRTFAVIDGETDKSGRRYAGRSGGWRAAHALEGALRELSDAGRLADGSLREIVTGLSDAIAAAQQRFGVAAEAADDPNVRFSAGAAIAHLDGDGLRLVIVGDCGARVDGALVAPPMRRADAFMGRLRASTLEALADLAPRLPLERRLEVARAYTVHGLAERPPGSDDIGAAIHEPLAARVHGDVAAAFPELDATQRIGLVDAGLRGAARLRNGTWPLAYAVLDGSAVPPELVVEARFDARAFHTLELFSDGYFGQPQASGRVAAWEAHIAEVERVDPHRIGRFASTKGSVQGRRADDRSVLIVRREPHRDEAACSGSAA